MAPTVSPKRLRLGAWLAWAGPLIFDRAAYTARRGRGASTDTFARVKSRRFRARVRPASVARPDERIRAARSNAGPGRAQRRGSLLRGGPRKHAHLACGEPRRLPLTGFCRVSRPTLFPFRAPHLRGTRWRVRRRGSKLAGDAVSRLFGDTPRELDCAGITPRDLGSDFGDPVTHDRARWGAPSHGSTP